MKSFSYKARDSSGAHTEGKLSASDRSEALKRLREINLVPIRMEECASHCTGETGKAHSGVRIVRNIFVVLFVACVIFALVKFAIPQKRNDLGVKDAPSATVRTPSAVAGVKISVALPEKPTQSQSSTGEAPAPLPIPTAAPKQHFEVASKPKAVSPVVMIDLRPGKTNSLPNGLSSGTERVLNAMFTARLGGPPPPLLSFPPDEVTNLVAVLSRDIIVFDSDDAVTVTKKENLAMVKQTLKKYLQEGGNAEDFMAYYRDVLKQAYEERTERQKAYNVLRMSGDEKAAAEYFESVNKAFEEKGYLPLSVPPSRPTQK